jgi:hypothetical protein
VNAIILVKQSWLGATYGCRLISENEIKFKLPQLLQSDSDRSACTCVAEHMMMDLQTAGSIMKSNKKTKQFRITGEKYRYPSAAACGKHQITT